VPDAVLNFTSHTFPSLPWMSSSTTARGQSPLLISSTPISTTSRGSNSRRVLVAVNLNWPKYSFLNRSRSLYLISCLYLASRVSLAASTASQSGSPTSLRSIKNILGVRSATSSDTYARGLELITASQPHKTVSSSSCQRSSLQSFLKQLFKEPD